MDGPHVNLIWTDPKLVQNKGHGQLDIIGLIHGQIVCNHCNKSI